uniref:Uncharacterized protein n=1 Tax=Candidatus Kentrum sp. TC TaxID=2126339 RepID=A0A450ZTJ2_9GAMM|nr:MAG: hypothetical protein BECKTC1821F_GA0114240_101451 [Candidatus Kentron sp. TC]
MSKEYNAVSERAQDPSEKGSVYDFLYHDVDRVNSFLSQFGDAGYLQNLTERKSFSTGKSSGTSGHANANVLIAKGGGNMRRETHEKGGESSERSYNPLWSNSLTLLDYLDERDMIVRDVENAAIGQFVLLSGSLEIMDASILERIIKSSVLKNFIKTEYKKTKTAQRNNPSGKRGKNTFDNTSFEVGMEFISMFPYTVQARMEGKYGSWSVLNNEFMLIHRNT